MGLLILLLKYLFTEYTEQVSMPGRYKDKIRREIVEYVMYRASKGPLSAIFEEYVFKPPKASADSSQGSLESYIEPYY